jgi:hypothetical protein
MLNQIGIFSNYVIVRMLSLKVLVFNAFLRTIINFYILAKK